MRVFYLREFQDPYLLATDFCNKHGLNHKAVAIIEQKIEEAIKKNDMQTVGERNNLSPNKKRQSRTPNKKTQKDVTRTRDPE